ncbi:hypothetical protein GsuE55_37970 (plasmid) [Geobacillus subterraneus]|uniref:Uncharacterized protein n=1 Tax=Geobacillus subterraneus TaxID=129338 RepID=A0A679G1J4_9BACL|nr:hypothetical protein GsuE55_37970 [Geobacillus subterraneus]
MHRLWGWMVIALGVGLLVEEMKPLFQGVMLGGAVLIPLFWKKEWNWGWLKRRRRWRKKTFSSWIWRLVTVYALVVSFVEIWQAFLSLGMASCAIRIWWENRKKGVAVS